MMEMEQKNNVVEDSKALEIAILLYLVKKIKTTLGNDSTSARAIALNEIRKQMKKETSSFLKNADKGIVQSLTDENKKVIDELLEKGGKPIAISGIRNETVKDSMDHFKKYIKTNNMLVNNQKITQYYTNFINAHVKDVVDCATTIEQATKKAIEELAQSGIKIIEYESGVKRNIDVVVRQQMEYASKQSAKEITDQFALENGITIFEFDAHANARPSHQIWQGKRFDVTGKEYPTHKQLNNNEDEEDYNCRHRYFPVWDRKDKYMFSKSDLNNINTKPFEWKGKQYDGYSATQKARSMEREIRALKREKALLKEDDVQLNAKLSKKNREYREFMKAFSTYPRTNRL